MDVSAEKYLELAKNTLTLAESFLEMAKLETNILEREVYPFERVLAGYGFVLREVVFRKYEDAKRVYDDLLTLIEVNGSASVYDFFDLCGFYGMYYVETGEESEDEAIIYTGEEIALYHAEEYGWKSLPKVPPIIHAKHGYAIAFPKDEELFDRSELREY